MNDLALLLDLLGDSEETKLLICTVIFCRLFRASAKWRVELRAKIGHYRNRCSAFFQGKIVNINQIVKTNSKVFFFFNFKYIIDEINSSRKGNKLMRDLQKKKKSRFNIWSWCPKITNNDLATCQLWGRVSKKLILDYCHISVGYTASYFVKIIWCSRWFCKPPIFRLCIALFAVAEAWLLLDIGWFVLISHIKEHTVNVVICAGGISLKCWQDISHGGNFHDTTSISFIKAYGFYFRVGVIFPKKTKGRNTPWKLPHTKISMFTLS